MYGQPSNICYGKTSDIHKTKFMVNMFIILGHVNNYGKIASYKNFGTQLYISALHVVVSGLHAFNTRQ